MTRVACAARRVARRSRAAASRRARADLHQRRRADRLQQLRELPPRRRSRADDADARTRTCGRGRRSSRTRCVSREMPPWGADPAHSLKMRNDRSLTQAQIDTIVAWVDGGAPKGSDADLPPMPKFAEGWTFGREPDYDPRDAGRLRRFRPKASSACRCSTRRCRGPRIASPRRSRFVRATAPSSTTPACSSSTFRRARRSSTAAW